MASPIIQNSITLQDFKVIELNHNYKSFSDDENDASQLTIDVNFSTGFSEQEKQMFSITFDVSMSNVDKSIDISLKAIGVFSTTNEIDKNFLNHVYVTQSAPAIVFPYLRSFLSTFSTLCGLPSIILPTYNFTQNKSDEKGIID